MSFSPGLPLARLTGRVFVISTPGDGQPGWAYFLCMAPQPDGASFADLWAGVSGIVLFTNARIERYGADALADRFQALLATPAASPVPWRVVAWTADPYDPADITGLHAAESQPGVFTLGRGWTGSWGAFGLMLDQELTVRLGTPSDPSVLSIDIAPHDVGLIHVTLAGRAQQVGFSRDGMHIPIRLAGQGAGSLRLSLGIDPSTLLCAFRCGFLHEAGAGTVFYPMVPARLRTINQLRAWDIWLNPIRPLDATCTRFSADGTGRLANPGFARAPADALAAPYFADDTGAPLTLLPYDPGDAEPDAIAGGFAFSTAPPALVPRGLSALYLAPCGLYRAAAGGRLMPGLTGSEFIQFAATDSFDFIPNQPAGAGLTTSWMRIRPGPGGTPGYYSQPGATGFYGGSQPFPTALDALLGTFTAASDPFPIVPYGGVFLPVPADANTDYLPPYAGLADPLALLEGSILTSRRHDALAVSVTGPAFRVEPTQTLPNPPIPGSAATPQGLVLTLNADGTINRLDLAVSPPQSGSPPPKLSFGPDGGVLPPLLGSLLVRDRLMLVMSLLPGEIPAARFDDILILGGFKLQVDLGAGGAILVFKFNDQQSLAALASRPEAWADAALFNMAPGAISRRLTASLDAARPAEAGEAFATLRAIMDDPGWTGVIAFDVLVDGDGMPLGLQMLLGGIRGELRAHHIGIETNRLGSAAGGVVLQDSSLFGVIRYDDPQQAADPPVLDYEVEHLLVVFSNSSITQSEARIAVTLDTVFGQRVWLAGDATNRLAITGVSQTIDGVDTFTFATTQQFRFDFARAGVGGPPRVLDRVVIGHATLVPVSRTPETGSPAAILVRLRMEGSLWFAADPFGAGLDLFSYGTAKKGLDFSGLAVEIGFTLAGGMVSGKTVNLMEDAIAAVPDMAAIRPNSFLAALPLQFDRLITTADALSKEARGASTVHIRQLEPDGGVPHITASPRWALEYDVHLGSLGALSDEHGGMGAKLLLGWGPSPVAPDAEAAAMQIQLPHLGGGAAGFSLEGLLTTQFGDANLIATEIGTETVFAILFSNVQLSLMGHAFPGGTMLDFAVFGGAAPGRPRNEGNIAWFLGAMPNADA